MASRFSSGNNFRAMAAPGDGSLELPAVAHSKWACTASAESKSKQPASSVFKQFAQSPRRPHQGLHKVTRVCVGRPSVECVNDFVNKPFKYFYRS